MTKTVHFQGINYQVPDWARWIAQDANGTIKVFGSEPKKLGEAYVSLGANLVICQVGAPMVLERIK